MNAQVEEFKNLSHYKLFKYLNSQAKAEAKTVWIEDDKLTLQPYQIVTSVRKLSEGSGIERNKTGRILKTLAREELIKVDASNRYTLITLTKHKEIKIKLKNHILICN